MPEVEADTTGYPESIRKFFDKYSWDAYPSKHLKSFKIPAFDLENAIASEEVLHITDQKVNDDDCAALSEALRLMRPNNLKQLFLTNNEITDVGCNAVASAIAELPSFELLYLARNRIGSAGLEAIAQHLCKTSVWQLVLTENKVGDAGAAALAAAVAADPANAFRSLRWLFLDATQLGDAGVEALCGALCAGGLRSIERLALQNNRITNAGLLRLADAIASGGALPRCQYVYVQNNAFDAQGRTALKAAADVHGIKVHFGWPPPTPR